MNTISILLFIFISDITESNDYCNRLSLNDNSFHRFYRKFTRNKTDSLVVEDYMYKSGNMWPMMVSKRDNQFSVNFSKESESYTTDYDILFSFYDKDNYTYECYIKDIIDNNEQTIDCDRFITSGNPIHINTTINLLTNPENLIVYNPLMGGKEFYYSLFISQKYQPNSGQYIRSHNLHQYNVEPKVHSADNLAVIKIINEKLDRKFLITGIVEDIPEYGFGGQLILLFANGEHMYCHVLSSESSCDFGNLITYMNECKSQSNKTEETETEPQKSGDQTDSPDGIGFGLKILVIIALTVFVTAFLIFILIVICKRDKSSVQRKGFRLLRKTGPKTDPKVARFGELDSDLSIDVQISKVSEGPPSAVKANSKVENIKSKSASIKSESDSTHSETMRTENTKPDSIKQKKIITTIKPERSQSKSITRKKHN